MKLTLTKMMLGKEWFLYGSAILLAYIMSLLTFYLLNVRFDSQLRGQFDKDGALYTAQLDLSYKYANLLKSEKWPGTHDENNRDFKKIWESLSINPQKTDHFDSIKNILLYGDPSFEGFSDRKAAILAPYISSPSNSLKSVMDQLDWSYLPKLFGDDKSVLENVQLFFSSELSEVLDGMQVNNTPYTLRRYLNGAIQFLTFIVAVTGVLLLLSFLIRIQYERESLASSIDSFDLPDNTEAYQVGQLQESIVKLQNAQKDLASSMRALVINTAETFSWRGKEEAENTLNLETAEIREGMDSRYGLVKYFAWAVPSIGFIGTVIGIGDALGNAHNVIGQSAEFETKGEIQIITGQLGIAFDTTLVSLLLSIVLVMLIHVITRNEEQLISSSVNTVKIELLQKVAPIERANKLRRYNLLLESLKRYTTPRELQTGPFVELKSHLEDNLDQEG